MAKLSQSTIEQLKHYVYLLIDPRDNKLFYVGEGVSNRVNDHEKWALTHELEQTRKLDRIREINAAGGEVKQVILRHGMAASTAFELESALIDFVGMNNLTNIVSGHYSAERGIMDLRDLEIKYQAKDAVFDEPVMLININRLYHPDISDAELYDVTRKHWAADLQRAQGVKVVCATFTGIVREVYEVDAWHSSPEKYSQPRKRIYFDGQVASESVRQKYIDHSVSKYVRKGNQNPIKYVGN